MPTPPPIRRQRLRLAAVAVRSFGNHSSGTEIVRPSRSWTVMASSLKLRSCAQARSVPKVFIPSLQESRNICFYNLPCSFQLLRFEPSRALQLHGSEPELAVTVPFFNMNVRRFVRLVAIEEKAKTIFPMNGGH